MEEHIKPFESPQEGHEYDIHDIPWISAVRTSMQLLSCDKEGYYTVNKNGILEIVYPTQLYFKMSEDVIDKAVLFDTGLTSELINSTITFPRFSHEILFAGIGDMVTNLGNNTFYTQGGGDPEGSLPNFKLLNANISDTVETIGQSCFRNCYYMTDLVIGKNVATIGSFSFMGCKELINITCKADIPPVLDVSVFDTDINPYFGGVDKDTAHLYVPEDSIPLYRQANIWGEFVRILPIRE